MSAACEAGQPVVRPRGVVTSDRVAVLAKLLETARANAAKGDGKIILDLTCTELLGARAIGLLAGRDDLVLRNIGPRLRRQFVRVGLKRLLDRNEQ